jgi:tetratricopeptide (TPR) repeat protein
MIHRFEPPLRVLAAAAVACLAVVAGVCASPAAARPGADLAGPIGQLAQPRLNARHASGLRRLAQNEPPSQAQPQPPGPSQQSPQDDMALSLFEAATEQERDAILSDPKARTLLLGKLYEELGRATDPDTGARLDQAIHQVWHHTGSPTVDVLLQHAQTVIGKSDYDTGLKILDDAIALSPQAVEAWYMRAMLHFRRNEPHQALADLHQVLKLDPKQYEAINGLASLLAQQGQKDKALALYRKALQINPFFQPARDGLQALSPPQEQESPPAPSRPAPVQSPQVEGQPI